MHPAVAWPLSFIYHGTLVASRAFISANLIKYYPKILIIAIVCHVLFAFILIKCSKLASKAKICSKKRYDVLDSLIFIFTWVDLSQTVTKSLHSSVKFNKMFFYKTIFAHSIHFLENISYFIVFYLMNESLKMDAFIVLFLTAASMIFSILFFLLKFKKQLKFCNG